MAVTSVETMGGPMPTPSVNSQTSLFLRILSIWHLIFGGGCFAGVLYLWIGGSDITLWIRMLSSVFLVLGGVGSLLVFGDLRRRKHRGRMLSLTINYLVFVVFLLWGLQVLGIYTGINSLAGTFGRGLPYLGIAFIGYLISAFGSRFEEDRPAFSARFNQVGKIFGIVGSVLFLIAVGILPGLLSTLSKFNQPLPILLIFGAAVTGVLLWMMWRAPTALVLGAKSDDNITLNGFLFLSPNLLGFLFFFAGPLVLSLYISFTDSDAFGTQNFIGLANYFEIFNLDIARLASPDQLAREVIDISIYDELTRF